MGPCGYPRVKDPWNNLKLFHILPHMDIINYSICVLHFGIINNQIPRVYLRYTKIPNISMRDLHDPELYTIEIINIKQSTTKPTTYKQYQPYIYIYVNDLNRPSSRHKPTIHRSTKI